MIKYNKGSTANHPVFEADDEVSPETVLVFLHKGLWNPLSGKFDELREEMSLAWRGRMIRFHTKEDRMYFCMGLELSSDWQSPVSGVDRAV